MKEQKITFFPSQAPFLTAWSEDRVNCHQISCSTWNSSSLHLSVSILKFSISSVWFIPHYIPCFLNICHQYHLLCHSYTSISSHIRSHKDFFEYCVYRIEETVLSTVRHVLNSQHNTRYYKKKCSDFQSP